MVHENMKTNILLVMALALFFLSLTYARADNVTLCQDVTQLKFIPCQVITPIITCTGDYTYTISNLTEGDVLLESDFLNPLGGGIYSFYFNYSDLGNYGLTLCDNETATILVTDNFLDNTTGIAFILVLLVTAFVIIYMGFVLRLSEYLKVLLVIIGSFFFLLAFGVLIKGFIPISSSIADLLTTAYQVLLWVIAVILAFFIIFLIFDSIKQIKVKKEEKRREGGYEKW
jgi:hypothetical protein